MKNNKCWNLCLGLKSYHLNQCSMSCRARMQINLFHYPSSNQFWAQLPSFKKGFPDQQIKIILLHNYRGNFIFKPRMVIFLPLAVGFFFSENK